MSLLVLKYAFAALIHTNILFSLQIYLGPSIHSKHALFNLISPSNLQCQVFFSSNVPLHFESTQIIPFSNQMEHYAYKPLKSNHPQLKCAVDSQTIQIMLSSRQMAHCTLEPLKSCPLQLKCIFAPLKHSNHLQYSHICTIALNQLKSRLDCIKYIFKHNKHSMQYLQPLNVHLYTYNAQNIQNSKPPTDVPNINQCTSNVKHPIGPSKHYNNPRLTNCMNGSITY